MLVTGSKARLTKPRPAHIKAPPLVVPGTGGGAKVFTRQDVTMASSVSTAAGIGPREHPSPRDFLYVATAAVAAIGAAASLVPLIDQMNPDASTLAAGGPVDLDVSKIEPGQQVAIRWRERPIFV